jgi:hypothetical protein
VVNHGAGGSNGRAPANKHRGSELKSQYCTPPKKKVSNPGVLFLGKNIFILFSCLVFSLFLPTNNPSVKIL